MAGGTYGGGNGSATTPYLVEDKADFLAMASAITGYFKQSNDISFSGSPGGYTIHASKSYDGNGFSIRDFASNKAMFTIIDGKVSNLTISNAVMSGNLSTGLQIFADQIRTSTGVVTNCHATGSVSYTGTADTCKVAGFVGTITTQANVRGCSFVGTVTTNHNGCNVGGFASVITSSYVSNCWSEGTISALNSFDHSSYGVGGFSAIISNANTEVKRCYSLCNVYGKSRVGGFAAMLGSGTNTVIEDCYAKGNVYGTEFNVGGFGSATYSSDSNTHIRRCYSTGSVEGAERVGGFVGMIGSAVSLNINNCYSLAPYVKRTTGSQTSFARFIAVIPSGASTLWNNNYALSTMEFRG